MIETFLLIALPYIAIAGCVVGTIYRIKTASLTYSALSSQFLESKSLMWGSMPFHLGIIVVLIGHLVALLLPGPWHTLLSYRPFLIAVEGAGIGFSAICALGLLVLLARRIISARVQAVTSIMDLVILGLLLTQILIGMGVAMTYKWGAMWATGTASPYIYSILTFQPDMGYIADMPVMVKAHIVIAWVILLLIPFSRLIHMFALPVHYLFRPWQTVVWNNARRNHVAVEQTVEHEGRRHFIKGIVGITAGGILLGAGAADKMFRFFFGPRLSDKEQAEMMETRLKRLQATAHQKQLELERQQSKFILISSLSELSSSRGKYFIDYQMQPALAFLDKDGLPILMSAKCTHLGCTVGNEVNDKGKILCPCHVSFFDVDSGKPDPDAPAKAPLPKLPWVLMDKKGTILARCTQQGIISGNTARQVITGTNVYIARSNEEITS